MFSMHGVCDLKLRLRWRCDSECSCSSTVPFNQRLPSSTPADTPTRKRLVDRHGVLLLNGSTDTHVLNSTEMAAAAQPARSPRPTGPCLSRGNVQFVAAPHRSSSSSLASSESETGLHSAPVYSTASVPYRDLGAPSYDTRPPSASQPTSLDPHRSTVMSTGPDFDRHQQSDVPTDPHTNPTVSPSLGFPASHSPASAWLHTSAPPCSCTNPTDVVGTAVSSERRRPLATATASSSQETIEIHLEQSPTRVKSVPRERFAVAGRNGGRRGTEGGRVRGRHTSPGTSRQRGGRNSVSDDDVERLMSLLRHFKAVLYFFS